MLGIIAVAHGCEDLWAIAQDGSLCPEAKENAGTIYQQLHEYLKDRRSEWRGVLTKNQAEATFYGNVTASSLLLCLGAVAFAPGACYVMGKHLSDVLPKDLVGYLLTAVLPQAAVCLFAFQGMLVKNGRLWTRHIACLSVDMRSIEEEEEQKTSLLPPRVEPFDES